MSSHSTDKVWSFPRRAIYRLFTSLAPIILNKYFQFHYIGLDNLNSTPEGKAVIYCANHKSHLDSIIFGCALARPHWKRRYVAFMASGKAMKKNFLFSLTRYFGAFPVFSSDPEPALRYSLKTLKKGLAVYISPQGGRISRTIFEDYFNLKEEGRTGVGRLILRMNGQVPVIPIYISRSAEVLGKSEIIPQYKGRVLIVFGKPMFFHQYFRAKGWTEDDEFYKSAREIANAIMSEIHELLKTAETNYIQLIKIKTGQNIDELGKEMIKRRKFQEFLKRLDKVNPDELAKYLAKKSTNPL